VARSKLRHFSGHLHPRREERGRTVASSPARSGGGLRRGVPPELPALVDSFMCCGALGSEGLLRLTLVVEVPGTQALQSRINDRLRSHGRHQMASQSIAQTWSVAGSTRKVRRLRNISEKSVLSDKPIAGGTRERDLCDRVSSVDENYGPA
jgi:hypothetical protein